MKIVPGTLKGIMEHIGTVNVDETKILQKLNVKFRKINEFIQNRCV
jgi:hypothetical protein